MEGKSYKRNRISLLPKLSLGASSKSSFSLYVLHGLVIRMYDCLFYCVSLVDLLSDFVRFTCTSCNSKSKLS